MLLLITFPAHRVRDQTSWCVMFQWVLMWKINRERKLAYRHHHEGIYIIKAGNPSVCVCVSVCSRSPPRRFGLSWWNFGIWCRIMWVMSLSIFRDRRSKVKVTTAFLVSTVGVSIVAANVKLSHAIFDYSVFFTSRKAIIAKVLRFQQ